jgi:hypothetical protein
MEWIIEASDTLDVCEEHNEKEHTSEPNACGGLCPCSITAYQTC